MLIAKATVLDRPSINNPASVVDPRLDEPLVVDWTVDTVVDNDIGGVMTEVAREPKIFPPLFSNNTHTF